MGNGTWREWLEPFGDVATDLVLRSNPGVGDKPWNPSENDRNAAWALYHELATRSTLEPLAHRSGDYRAAVDSVYQVFGLTRELLTSHGRAGHFAVLAAACLEMIRPFTSRWHRAIVDGTLTRDDERRAFRRELTALQDKLIVHAALLGVLGGAFDDAEQALDTLRARRKLADPAQIGARFNDAGIYRRDVTGEASTEAAEVYAFDHVVKRENDWIAARRLAVRPTAADVYGGLGRAAERNEPLGLVGLCLSGGGIRSATFSLGVAQVLAERRLLSDVDYLSTVSGGGFIGSNLMTSFDAPPERLADALPSHLVAPSGHVEADGVRFVRNRSKYLNTGGRLSWLIAKATARIALHPFVLPLVIGVFAALGLLFVRFSWWWMLVAAVVSLLVSLSFPRRWSGLHAIYAEAIQGTFLDASDGPRNQSLSENRSAKGAPYHLLGATVNLPGSDDVELRGRKSDFFTFGPLFSGSNLTGFQETKKYEDTAGLTYPMAAAISGAALAPLLGTTRVPFAVRPLQRPLLSVLGLSHWLPNPKVSVAAANTGWWKRLTTYPSARLAIREVFTGKLTEDWRMINLSDGGHIENLGLFALLQRRCKFIIAVDGSEDPDLSCSGLTKAIRYASIDLGVTVEIDTSELAVDADGYSASHFALGTIDYGVGATGGNDIGYLLYLKLSLTGNERDYVEEYRRRNPKFPHESTGDQFFGEDQFEAYRALGEHVARDLFSTDLVGDWEPSGRYPMRRWLEALVDSLQPPAPQTARN